MKIKKFIKNLLKLWKYAKKCDIIYWYCIVSSHDGGIITRRKFNMKTKVNTKSLVILGLMTALTMIFSFTPIGSIPIGPLVITLNVIPIAIAAVTVGPVGSAVIGGVFGLLSFLQCFGIGVPSGMGAALVAIDPVLAFVQRQHRLCKRAYGRKEYHSIHLHLCRHKRSGRNGCMYICYRYSGCCTL